MAVHANICTDVVRAVGIDLALFCVNFLSICGYSVYESVGEVLSSPLLPSIRSMSSANRRLYMGLLPMEMDV